MCLLELELSESCGLPSSGYTVLVSGREARIEKPIYRSNIY